MVQYSSLTIENTNTVNGKPVLYLVGKEKPVISQENSVGYLGLVCSDGAKVENLVIGQNGEGILLASSHCELRNILVENCEVGTCLMPTTTILRIYPSRTARRGFLPNFRHQIPL